MDQFEPTDIPPNELERFIAWAKDHEADPAWLIGRYVGRLNDVYFGPLLDGKKGHLVSTSIEWQRIVSDHLRELCDALRCRRHHDYFVPRPPATAPTRRMWMEPEREGGAPKPDRHAFVESVMATCPFLTTNDSQEVLRYQQGIFNGHAEAFIKEWVEREFTLQNLSASTNFRVEVINAVKARTFVGREELDPPGLLCVENGVVKMHDGSLVPHSPDFKLTCKVPVRYDADAKCPRWLAFLESAMTGPDQVEGLREAFGYCLRYSNPYQLAFMIVGPTKSGKSTTLRVLRALLGDANVTAMTLKMVSENRFAKARLRGKLANICADLPREAIRDTGTFKMLTGGDPVEAEQKFVQKADPFVWGGKLVFSANQLPEVNDRNEAFFERWGFFDFPTSVPLEKRDPNLTATLLSELPGILNWAIGGLKELDMRSRFGPGVIASDLSSRWRRESDSLVWFVEEGLVEESLSWTAKEDLYVAYAQFCEEHGLTAKSKQTVGKEFPSKCPSGKVRSSDSRPEGRTVHGWSGVRLKEATAEEGLSGKRDIDLLFSGVAGAHRETIGKVRTILTNLQTFHPDGMTEEMVYAQTRASELSDETVKRILAELEKANELYRPRQDLLRLV